MIGGQVRSFVHMPYSYSINLNNPILLSGLNCSNINGSEMYLTMCPQSPIAKNNCTHSEDIILSCLTGMF